jgi:hypothetical protein
MTTVEALVQGYYGRSDLLQRIEAALRKAGVDPKKPGFRDLHPFDQLHGLGILATEEHAARAGVGARAVGFPNSGERESCVFSRTRKVTANPPPPPSPNNSAP